MSVIPGSDLTATAATIVELTQGILPTPAPIIPTVAPASLQDRSPAWGLTASDIKSVLTMMSQNTVCGVVAPPGSGKSTALMQAIVETGATVFVTEPTVPATEALRSYMASRLKPKGISVGMAAEGNVQYTNHALTGMRDSILQSSVKNGGGKTADQEKTEPSTRLVYCTGGHMRRLWYDIVKHALKISASKASASSAPVSSGLVGVNLAFCDVLVLDESHSGTVDLDSIMVLWKFAVESGASVPRLLLATATPDIASTPFPSAPLHEIHVKGFPVTIEYVGKDYRPESLDLYRDTATQVLDRHAKAPVTTTTSSTWLVFAPGLNEINAIAGSISNSLVSLTGTVDTSLVIAKAHSSNTVEEKAELYRPTPKGKRRVIIATNIAEMSLTIDGVDGVFDTLAEKIGETSLSGGLRLTLTTVSKASANQRAGRTGRTVPGFVLRMCSQQFFLNLSPNRPSEIKRVPLHTLVVETMDTGLNPVELFKTMVDRRRLDSSLRLLKLLGMVTGTSTKASGSLGTVTDAGRFAAQFPLSVRGSALLWEWIGSPVGSFGTGGRKVSAKPLFPAISMIALIDCFGPSYFWYPRRPDPKTTDVAVLAKFDAMMDTYYDDHFARYDAPNDLEVMLKMWLALMEHFKSLNPKRWDVAKFAGDHALNGKKLLEVFNIARQVSNTLARMGYQVKLGPFTPANVTKAMAPYLRKVYADSTFRRAQGRTKSSAPYINTTTEEQYKLDTRNPLMGKTVDDPELLGLLTAEIQTGANRAPVRFISLSYPLRAEVSGDLPSRSTPIAPAKTSESVIPRSGSRQTRGTARRVASHVGRPGVTAALPPLPGLETPSASSTETSLPTFVVPVAPPSSAEAPSVEPPTPLPGMVPKLRPARRVVATTVTMVAPIITPPETAVAPAT